MTFTSFSVIRQMGIVEAVLFVGALWWYNIGEDYYTQWMSLILSFLISLKSWLTLNHVRVYVPLYIHAIIFPS